MEEVVAARYGKLTGDEAKALVVEAKWVAVLGAYVQSELDHVSHSLTSRIAALATRYGVTQFSLTADVALLSKRVDEHLKRMGATWN